MTQSTEPHSSSSSNRTERLRSIAHYLTAFVLVLEGVSKLEHPDGLWPFIILCWLCAAAIAGLSFAHHRIEKVFPHLQPVMRLAEATVCAGLVFVTHHEGKVGLPYAWLAAALLLTGVAVAEIVHFPKRRRVQ